MSETFHNKKKFSRQNGLSMFNESWGRVDHWVLLISLGDALYKLVDRCSGNTQQVNGGRPSTWRVDDSQRTTFLTNNRYCQCQRFIFLSSSKLLVQGLETFLFSQGVRKGLPFTKHQLHVIGLIIVPVLHQGRCPSSNSIFIANSIIKIGILCM